MTALPARPGRRREGRVAAPRLARHVIRLDDDHRVQIAVAGRGVPLVVVHGYTAEGLLYAQSLSRLVSSGFRVIAVDAAGHGGTAGLAYAGGSLRGYAELLGRVVDHLGVRHAVFAGHSMGGRLVTELAANEPRRAIAVLLVDAIVGDTWDGMVQAFRMAPPLLAGTGAALLVDTMSTVPIVRNPTQAVKLGRLWLPNLVANVRRPLNLVGAAVSILRSGPSRWMLERLADELVPVYVLHGDRDFAIPLRTARDAARRARGELIVVHGATHSWLLRDPETLPAIVAEMLEDSLGDAIRLALTVAGLPLEADTIADMEQVLYDPDARVFALTPPLEFEPTSIPRTKPQYRWTRRAR